jgi:hypothetical protein
VTSAVLEFTLTVKTSTMHGADDHVAVDDAVDELQLHL